MTARKTGRTGDPTPDQRGDSPPTGSRRLPCFNERPGYVKTQPFEDPYGYRVETVMRSFLQQARGLNGGRPRVLDVGCGRGEMVAQLLSEGWEAWGFDVADAYVRRGVDYLVQADLPTDRLSSGPPDRLPFASGCFDVVVSNQVLEHVQDLPALTAEIARVSAVGAIGLHVFPGRRILLEPHLRMPLIHRLRPGRVRTALTRTAIGVGWSVDHHDHLSVPDRAHVYLNYLDDQTAYRRSSAMISAFERAGLSARLDYRASEEALARSGTVRRRVLAAAGRSELVGMAHLWTMRR